MKRRLMMALAVALVCLAPLAASTAPFGLDWGMTEAEIRSCSTVLDRYVQKDSTGYVELTVVPPESRADFTVVAVLEGRGLYKVIAKSSVPGDRSRYADILTGIYGEPYVRKTSSGTILGYRWTTPARTVELDLGQNGGMTLTYNPGDLIVGKCLKPDGYGL